MRRRRLTDAERRAVYAKTGGRCAYCGCWLDVKSMAVDHVVSLHNHGADDMDNMFPACLDCNYYKGGCNPDGFRRKLKKAFAKERKCDFVKRIESKYAGWGGVFYFEMEGIRILTSARR